MVAIALRPAAPPARIAGRRPPPPTSRRNPPRKSSRHDGENAAAGRPARPRASSPAPPRRSGAPAGSQLAEKGTDERASPENADCRRPPKRRSSVRSVSSSECQERYQSVNDYTCTFFKRERISGKLIPAHIMAMKVRTKPQSIYLKFQQPAKGREAIYIAGRHGGKVLAHDVGFNKLLAGTLALEPTSARAMDDCRHPITEAGIGPLLETVSKRWALELNQNETVVVFEDMLVGEQPCQMIETTHPQKSARLLVLQGAALHR